MVCGMNSQLLTPDQVAEELSISKHTFYTYWREWGIPVLRVGRHLRVKPSDLERWLEGQRVT